MIPFLEVDTDELRRAATALAGTATRASTGSTPAPEPPLVPRWLAADAGALAADAARRQLALLGADLAGTARQVSEAAAAYELADARAVTRLRLAR